MANLLDEVTGPVNDDGRDVNVINRQIPRDGYIQINPVRDSIVGYNTCVGAAVCSLYLATQPRYDGPQGLRGGHNARRDICLHED